MIGYRIFFAAILSLLIILNKIALTIDSPINNNKFTKWLIGILYILASFYWILSIFGDSREWYAYLISGFVGFCVFIYYFFVSLYEKEEHIEDKEFNYDTLIGRIGSINSEYEDGYIGTFLDTKELVFISSIDNLEINDNFIITEIKDGKIYAIKYENNLN